MMMAAAVAAAPDLFAWREVEDARAAAEAANEARERAIQRLHTAPHGEVQNRARALQEATHRALIAELAAARMAREALN